MAINKEGPEHSTFVIDTNKIACPYCGGVKMMLSNLMDDPNDITEDSRFAAHYITYTGDSCQGLVGLCVQCGHTSVPIWYIHDVTTADGSKGLTMTNIDASSADGLAGCWALILVGTDIGKYVAIASNTAVAGTVITTAFNVNNDADGILMITNIEPVGLTKITS